MAMVTDRAPTDERDPLFTLGWFRTGSTFLYRVFRRGLPNHQHFYETTNPRIPHLFEDPTGEDELSGKRSLFDSIEDRREIVEDWFDPSFGRQNFFLDEHERIDELDRYLVELANTGESVHFQMNRALGRLDYLRGLFPSATVLLLVRNPWATWCSWHDYPDNPTADDLPLNTFQMASMFKELRVRLPDKSMEFWGLDRFEQQPPLESFLALWGFLHYLVLQQIDDFPRYHVVRYEDLVGEWEQSLDLIEEDLELRLSRSNLPEPCPDPVERWRDYIDSSDVGNYLERLPEESPTQSMLEQLEYV